MAFLFALIAYTYNSLGYDFFHISLIFTTACVSTCEKQKLLTSELSKEKGTPYTMH